MKGRVIMWKGRWWCLFHRLRSIFEGCDFREDVIFYYDGAGPDASNLNVFCGDSFESNADKSLCEIVLETVLELSSSRGTRIGDSGDVTTHAERCFIWSRGLIHPQ